MNSLIIVGGGPAGIHAALQCRESWPGQPVILLEADGETGYCNPLLGQFMSGQVEEEKLYYWRPAEDPLLQLRTGTKVKSLDRSAQILFLEKGEKLAYDRLILTPGGQPIVPPLGKADSLRGIFPVRTLAAARKIRQWASEHREVAVLGGGLVGVKTAVAFRNAGFPVSLIEKEDHLLPQALSANAAGPIAAHLRKLGIGLFLGQMVEEMRGERANLRALKSRGEWISCQTLLIAAGSKPNLDFLEGSGLLREGELLVSSALQTMDPKVFAAGDAVTISAAGQKFIPWTWPQAVSQGKAAARNLYQPVPMPLIDLTRPNSMHIQGLSFVVLGAPQADAEVISCARPDEGIYRELFLRDGHIVGGALVGDISGAGFLHFTISCQKETGHGDAAEWVRPISRTYPQFPFPKQRRQAWLSFTEECRR